MAIGGSGTQADPWTIGSSADLVAFAGSTSYWASGTYAKLTADIDMTGVSFTPIGNGTTQYVGTFDGDNHVIRNLTISASTSDFQGLFGYVNGGTVKNIGCEGFDITGYTYVGGLVSRTNSAIISNCYAYDCTATGAYDVGGLVGRAQYASTISNCYAYDCTATTTYYVGGLVGRAESSASISNCYTYSCTISGSECVGGLIGRTNTAIISNCAIYGGTHGGTLVSDSTATTITNCYTSNDVSSAVFHTRGFWDGTGVSGTTYLSWDFTTPIWYWDTTDNLPILRAPATPNTISIFNGTSWTDGTPYVWNGTAWVEADTVYIFNGTAWVEKD